MALSFEQSAQLMNDPQFRGRVKVACLNFASRLLTNGSGGNNALLRWAQQAFQNPDMTSQQSTPATVMEPGVQGAGADIDDGGLQFSVENAVQKLI